MLVDIRLVYTYIYIYIYIYYSIFREKNLIFGHIRIINLFPVKSIDRNQNSKKKLTGLHQIQQENKMHPDRTER